MLVKDCMTRNVETVRPETSIEAAAQKMRSLDVGSLPVWDGNRVIGIVTERDPKVPDSEEHCDDPQ